MKYSVFFAILITSLVLYISCTTTQTAAQASETTPDAVTEVSTDTPVSSSENATQPTPVSQELLEAETEIIEPEVFDLPLYAIAEEPHISEPEIAELSPSENEAAPQQIVTAEQETIPTPTDTQNATQEQPSEVSVDSTSDTQTVSGEPTLQESTKPQTIITPTTSFVQPDKQATANTNTTSTSQLPKADIPTTANTSEQENLVAVAEEELTDTTPTISMPTPSRSITLHTNQYLDVDYIGRGWIYLGELHTTDALCEDLLSFYNRDISSTKNTVFTLRAEKQGETLLHFYKNDPVNNEYIDDYLAVKIEDGKALTDHITAPSYADYVPQRTDAQKKQATTPSTFNQKTWQQAAAAPSVVTPPVTPTTPAKTNTQIATPAVSETPTPITTVKETPDGTQPGADALLEQAQTAYNNAEYQKALNLITTYLDVNQTHLDAALFLQAQILEQKSPVRDIKQAIVLYDTIIKRYPSSQYWAKANERSKYLKRFYINIQ